MEYPNGWTMVKVPTAHDLDVEGEYMGHCVGGDDYADAVKRGKCTIYSLRDPKNEPHVTLEVEEAKKPLKPGSNKNGRVVIQVQGKQNEEPVEKYHGMLEKFFRRENLHLQDETFKFNKDPAIFKSVVDGSDVMAWYRVAESRHLTPALAEELFSKALPLALPKKGKGVADANGVLSALANNPKTPASVVEQLLSISDADTQEHIMGSSDILANPNVPPALLDKHLSLLSVAAKKAIKAADSEDEDIYHLAHSDSKQLMSLAKNPNLTEAQQKTLWDICTATVKAASGSDYSVPHWVAEVCEPIAEKSKSASRLTTLAMWALSSDVFDEVYGHHGSPTISERLLANPSTPASILTKLLANKSLMHNVIQDSNSEFEKRIFDNPALGAKGLVALVAAHDRTMDEDEADGGLWTLVRKSPNYNPKLFSTLLKASPHALRASMAYEDPMTDATFDLLTSDPKKIPDSLASNEKLTERQANALVEVAPATYWLQNESNLDVASNPKLSVANMKKLLAVARSAKGEARGYIISYLVTNPSLPFDIQMDFAKNSPSVAYRLLDRKDLTLPVAEAILGRFKDGKDPSSKRYAAQARSKVKELQAAK